MEARRFWFRLMPGGIAARIALTIVIAMLLVQALNGVLYILEGRETPRFPNSPQFTEEVAGLVRQIEAMPDDERRAFVGALANPLVKVDWVRRLRRPIPPPTIVQLAVQRERLRQQLERRVEIEERVTFGPPGAPRRSRPISPRARSPARSSSLTASCASRCSCMTRAGCCSPSTSRSAASISSAWRCGSASPGW
jgi:hypothetical protein